MDTAIVSELAGKPWVALNTLITAALPGAVLAYAVVWWAIRPKDGAKVSFVSHAVGLITTVLVSAISRIISIATFGGRSALELVGFGVATLYILVIPAIVAATFLACRKHRLTTRAAPSATSAPTNEAHASLNSTVRASQQGAGNEACAEEFAQIEAGKVDKGIWTYSKAEPVGDGSKT